MEKRAGRDRRKAAQKKRRPEFQNRPRELAEALSGRVSSGAQSIHDAFEDDHGIGVEALQLDDLVVEPLCGAVVWSDARRCARPRRITKHCATTRGLSDRAPAVHRIALVTRPPIAITVIIHTIIASKTTPLNHRL